MKTSVEITLKSLSLSSIPEKALLVSRNLLTVEMIWPKSGTPRKSASRQVTMKKGKVDFSAEPWAKRVLFREDIDGHTAFTVSITEPVTLQKLHRLLQLTAKAALKEGADMIDAALVSYGDIAAAPVDALATMVAEKDAPRVIVQGVLDYDDLPAAGETREVVIPLTRPKFSRKIGTLTLLVQGWDLSVAEIKAFAPLNQILLMYSPYHEVLGDCPYVKLVPYSQNKAYVPVAEDLAARVLTLPTYYGLPL